MNISQSHIIRKQIIEIHNSPEIGRQNWEEKIRSYYYNIFLPLLEREFNKLTSPEEHIQIDSLELELELTEDLFDSQTISFAFEKALISAIQRADLSDSKNKQTTQNKAVNCLKYFIQYGVLPWWADSLSHDALNIAMHQLLSMTRDEVLGFLADFQHSSFQLRRFIAHCPEDVLMKLSVQLGGSENSYLSLIKALNQQSVSIEVWEILFHLLFEYANNLEEPKIISSIFLAKLEDQYGRKYLKKILAAPSINKWKNQKDHGLLAIEQAVLQLTNHIRKFSPDQTGYQHSWIQLQYLLRKKPVDGWSKEIRILLTDLSQRNYHSLRIWALLMQEHLKNPDIYLSEISTLIELMRWQGWEKVWASFPGLGVKKTVSRQYQLSDIINLLADYKDPMAIVSWLDQFGKHGIEALLNETRFHDFSSKKIVRQPKTPDPFDQSDSIYIHHGGIILTAPFLPQLFKRLGLLKGQFFINEDKRQRAIYILHYLATGENEAAEFFYPLMKVLTGAPIDLPLFYGIQLTNEEKSETDQMLVAILEHGRSAFGKISTETMRKRFFRRKAMISSQGNHWHLAVEKQDFDAILTRLPWGFQIIKLPWMEHHIVVEW